MIYSVYRASDGEILRHITGPPEYVSADCLQGEEFYLNCPADATHIINNEPVTIIPEPVPPTEAEIVASLTAAVQRHLDSTARQRNYDGVASLASYAGDPDPVFNAEGMAGKAWRSSVWRACYEFMATVKAEMMSGTRTSFPTAEELITVLPEFTWPT